jgi:uncharacterized protein (DUF924 family)
VSEVADAIHAFWFGDDLESLEAVTSRSRIWFASDRAFDASVRERFGALPRRAAAGACDDWQASARSCLALVLVLDQFPRNLYRGSAESFAYDAVALEVADLALERGFDAKLTPIEAVFFYLPLEHAEDADCQARSVERFGALAQRCDPALRDPFDSFLSYAVRHREVIERFGRFPHRNALLGRESTPEERAYLASGGDAFGG